MDAVTLAAAKAHAKRTYAARRQNRFAAIGDSIVGGFPETFAVVGSTDIQLAPGWFNRACVQSGQKMRYLRNAGVSGNTSTQVLARLQADVIAYAPDWCFVAVGENDAGNSITLATTLANLSAIWAALRSANIEPILCTVMGKSTGVPSEGTLTGINEYIRSEARRQGLHLCDFAAFMLDPSNHGQPVNNVDGTHPNAAGYKQMCDFVVASFVPKLPLYSPPLAVVTSNPNNIIPNPVFLLSSAGVPTYWAQSVAGTSTTTPTVVAAPSGSVGNFWKLDCTVGGTGRQYKLNIPVSLSTGAMTAASATLTATGAQFSQADIGRTVTVAGAGPAGATLTSTITAQASTTSVTLADAATTTVSAAAVTIGRFAAGDNLSFSGRVIATVEAGVCSYSITMSFNGPTGYKARLLAWKVDVDGVFYLPYTVPAGVTSVDIVVDINSNTTGTGTVQLGQLMLLNKTALGLAA